MQDMQAKTPLPKTSIPIVKFGDLKGAGPRAKVRENIKEKYVKKFY